MAAPKPAHHPDLADRLMHAFKHNFLLLDQPAFGDPFVELGLNGPTNPVELQSVRLEKAPLLTREEREIELREETDKQ
jgi:hypothetical protein